MRACLLMMLIVGYGSVSAVAQTQLGRNVFVAAVKKGSVTKYFNRLAASRYDLVFTAAPLNQEALFKRQIKEVPGNRLFAVEFKRSSVHRLPGEILRFDKFAVLSLPINSPLRRSLFQSNLVSFQPVLLTEIPHRAYPAVIFPGYRMPAGRGFTGGERNEIDPVFLKGKLAEFSGAVPVVINGQEVRISERGSPKGRELARAYLAQEYTKLGFTVKTVPYANRGANFVAEKKGSDPSRFLMVASHFDSVGNAGADDDGSGTISALALAQAMATTPLRYNLRIVAFDEEEVGIVGSQYYAFQLDQSGELSGLLGVVDLEMTGFNSGKTGAFSVIDCNENTSASLSALVMGAIRAHGISLTRVDACSGASDHSSFWNYEKPAIVVAENFFGGGRNLCYHQNCDTIDKLDFEYMAKITQAVTLAVKSLLIPEGLH